MRRVERHFRESGRRLTKQQRRLLRRDPGAFLRGGVTPRGGLVRFLGGVEIRRLTEKKRLRLETWRADYRHKRFMEAVERRYFATDTFYARITGLRVPAGY